MSEAPRHFWREINDEWQTIQGSHLTSIVDSIAVWPQESLDAYQHRLTSVLATKVELRFIQQNHGLGGVLRFQERLLGAIEDQFGAELRDARAAQRRRGAEILAARAAGGAS